MSAGAQGFELSQVVLGLKHRGLEILDRVDDLVVGKIVSGRRYSPAEGEEVFSGLELGIWEESGGEDDGWGDDAVSHELIATMKYELGELRVTYLSVAQNYLDGA